MASTSLGSLSLDIVAKTAGLTAGMNKAERQARSTAYNMRKQFAETQREIAKSMQLIRKVVIAGTAVLATNKAIESVREVINQMDEMRKTAQRIGTETQDIAGLQLAFELGGASAQDMQTAMQYLAKDIGKNSETFKTLGVNIQDATGRLKSSRQVMGEVADAFSKMPDGAQKTAYAMELFGRSGANIIPVLNGGAAGFAEMDEKAKVLGLTLDTKTAEQAERFNDQMTLLSKKVDGLKMQFASGLIPALDTLSNAFITTGEKTNYAKTMGEGFGYILIGVTKLATYLIGTLDALGNSLGAVGAKMSTFIEAQKERYEIMGFWDWFTSPLNSTEGKDKAQTEALKKSGENYERNQKTINDEWNYTFNKKMEDIESFAAYLSAPVKSSSELLDNSKKIATFTGNISKKSGSSAKAIKSGANAAKAQADALKKAADEAQKLAAFKENLQSQIKVANYSYDNALSAFGFTNNQREKQQGTQGIKQDNQRKLDEINFQFNQGNITSDIYQQERQALQEALRQQLSDYDDYQNKLAVKRTEGLLGAKTAMQQYVEDARDMYNNVGDAVNGVLNGMTSAFTNNISQMIEGSKSLREGFSNIASTIANDMVQALVKLGVQWAMSQALQASLGSSSTALGVVQAQTLSAAWAPAAAFATLATEGSNVPVAMAGLSATTGYASSMALFGMAHDGIDKVPQTGTWLLQQGERVTTASTSAKLDKTLSQIQNTQQNNRSNINVVINSDGSGNAQSDTNRGRELGKVIQTAIQQWYTQESRSGGQVYTTTKQLAGA